MEQTQHVKFFPWLFRGIDQNKAWSRQKKTHIKVSLQAIYAFMMSGRTMVNNRQTMLKKKNTITDSWLADSYAIGYGP